MEPYNGTSSYKYSLCPVKLCGSAYFDYWNPRIIRPPLYVTINVFNIRKLLGPPERARGRFIPGKSKTEICARNVVKRVFESKFYGDSEYVLRLDSRLREHREVLTLLWAAVSGSRILIFRAGTGSDFWVPGLHGYSIHSIHIMVLPPPEHCCAGARSQAQYTLINTRSIIRASYTRPKIWRAIDFQN